MVGHPKFFEQGSDKLACWGLGDTLKGGNVVWASVLCVAQFTVCFWPEAEHIPGQLVQDVQAAALRISELPKATAVMYTQGSLISL